MFACAEIFVAVQVSDTTGADSSNIAAATITQYAAIHTIKMIVVTLQQNKFT